MTDGVDKKPLSSLMLYDPGAREFRFKVTEEASPVSIPETQTPALLATIPTAAERDLLQFLLDEARKRPLTWAEASNAPLAKGQALV